MNISLIGVNARFTHSCLALFYLRNELHRYCPAADVSIAQYSINDPYFELILRISERRSDYYFFSALIWNSEIIANLIKDLTVIQPQCFCVVGGPQAKIVVQECGSNRVVCVEGYFEQVPLDFYLDLQLKTLRSIYVCDREVTAFSFPFKPGDFDDALANRHIYYESSRGCPFSCSYCLSANDTRVIHKELQVVEAELTEILQHNPRELRFIDRTFNDSSTRALAIWKILAGANDDCKCHFEISPHGFTEEMYSLLAHLPPGKFEFEIGIQSTHRKTLQAIKRSTNISAARKVVRRIARLETVFLHVDLILGLPFETKESFYQSFRDVFYMEPHYIQMGLLKVLPDTPLAGCIEEYGLVVSKKPPYSLYANNWMSSEVLRGLYWFGECVERFINNRYFVSLWRYLRKLKIDIAAFFQTLTDEANRTGFFYGPANQERLTKMLVEVTAGRDDAELIFSLLRYDWMRCGHKYLPECLQKEYENSFKDVKREAFSLQRDGAVKNSDERTYCFKKGMFMQFSSEVLGELGYEVEAGTHYLCFLPEREHSLFRHNKVIVFQTV